MSQVILGLISFINAAIISNLDFYWALKISEQSLSYHMVIRANGLLTSGRQEYF